MFVKASRRQKKLRMSLAGPSGSGKTYTALAIGSALAAGSPTAAETGAKVAVLDTERGSASLYSDRFNFDVVELDSFNPENYIKVINEASEGRDSALIIDSLSHAWFGQGGVLDQVNKRGGNSFTDGWGKVGTPLQNRLMDAILNAPLHIIATMRVKSEYVIEADERGKSVPRRVGLKEVQRDGVEYEFDIVGLLDLGNTMVIEKSRMPDLTGAIVDKPDGKFAKRVLDWLGKGDAPEPKPAATTEPASTSAPAAASKLAAPTAPKPPAPANKPAVAPSSPKTNGTAREPAVLRAALVAFASRTPVVAGEQFVKNAMASLHHLVRNDDTKRKAIMQYLFGKDSGNDLTAGECMALTQWIGMSKTNNEWVPAAMAVTEGDAVLRTYELERGQQEMPF